MSFRRLALISWIIVASASLFISPGQAETFPSLCLFKFWWGVSCPGCGMGRALLAAFQGHWAMSFHYHALGLPFLVVWTAWLAFSFLPETKRLLIPVRLKKVTTHLLLWGAGTGLVIAEFTHFWRP